jgi:hypothetical protein
MLHAAETRQESQPARLRRLRQMHSVVVLGMASARRTWRAHLPDARSARPTGALHRLLPAASCSGGGGGVRPCASCASLQAGARRRAYATSRGNGRRSASPMRRRPQACVRCLPAGATVIAAVLAPIAAVVTAIRSPVMTVLDDGRGTNDGRGSRDRSTTEYSHPASTSWS